MTAAQLTLSAPGFCRRCNLHRLSVADRDGICCHCCDHERLEPKPGKRPVNTPTKGQQRGPRPPRASWRPVPGPRGYMVPNK